MDVERVLIGTEAFEVVDGREIALGDGEGYKFALNQVPVAGWAGRDRFSNEFASDTEGISSAVGEDVFLRDFESRIQAADPPTHQGTTDAVG